VRDQASGGVSRRGLLHILLGVGAAGAGSACGVAADRLLGHPAPLAARPVATPPLPTPPEPTRTATPTPRAEPTVASEGLPPPRVRVWSSPAYRVRQLVPNAPANAIGLTIDDGPSSWTPEVLAVLARNATAANFCMVGVHVDAYPALARAVATAGHGLVNHSQDHRQPFNLLPAHTMLAEIRVAQRAIRTATGRTPRLFRAPGGDWSPLVLRATAAVGLLPLDWDVDPRDWARPGTSQIIRALLRVRPGDIVLCHDGGGDRSETVRALATVLPIWRERGLLPIHLDRPAVTRAVVTRPTTSPSPRRSVRPTASPSASPSASPTASPTPSGSAAG